MKPDVQDDAINLMARNALYDLQIIKESLREERKKERKKERKRGRR